MKRLLLTLLGLLLFGSPAQGQIALSTNNTPVLEDFNTFAGSGFAPIPGAGQLDSDAFAAQGFSEGDLSFGATNTSGDFARGTSAGSVTTGGIYSFETSPGDFALGVQPIGSDFTPGAFIARYHNLTGGLIDDVNVAYEIKVYNDQGRANNVTLSHAASSTCETDPALLAFTAVPAADYTSPQAADASPVWQTINRGVHIAGLSVAAMDCFYVRLSGNDVSGTGSRDEFALDDLTVTPNPDTPLPVELTAFSALLDGDAVALAWETASETNNAGFEVQSAPSPRGAPWQALGFVEGHGTTALPRRYAYRTAPLPPGRYRFRLKQIDYDGTVAYSPEVEVAVGVPGAYHLAPAYPNPFHAKTAFSLSVARGQRVVVAVYDLLGRRRAALYNGHLEAGASRALTVDAGALPAGLYFIAVRGIYFTATQRVLRVR